jgi:hypothetical protein
MSNKKYNLEIIAGHCSFNPEKIDEIYELAKIRVKNKLGKSQRAVWGTRVVGLKSRTNLDIKGDGMGIDFSHYMKSPLSQNPPPSIEFAKKIINETGLIVATEIMLPHIQLPYYESHLPKGKLLIWNPSVMQLGWPIIQMARYASKHGWYLGIKNGKAIDQNLKTANNPKTNFVSSMQKSWMGLTTYAQGVGDKLVLIHRGVETPDKGLYRNGIVHEVARKTKRNIPEAKLYFDPSHTRGPKMRHKIIETTIHAMYLRDRNHWLYDGILIEAGTSPTDTEQHLTINEMEILVKELAKFRNLREPDIVI